MRKKTGTSVKGVTWSRIGTIESNRKCETSTAVRRVDERNGAMTSRSSTAPSDCQSPKCQCPPKSRSRHTETSALFVVVVVVGRRRRERSGCLFTADGAAISIAAKYNRLAIFDVL